MTYEQIKAINDAMSFLSILHDCRSEVDYLIGRNAHEWQLTNAGVPKEICDHFFDLVRCAAPTDNWNNF